MFDYGEIAATLRRCQSAHSAAESQGFAVGLLAGGVEQPLKLWQQELYADFDPADVLAGECRSMLDRVFASVFDPAADALSLLLPGDIVVDAARLVAVRDWCQGFLFGFGLAGERVNSGLSPEARGLLHDISEISRLETDDVENSEENQSALIEIEEFLRVGVMLLRDEVNNRQGPDEPE